MKKKKVLISLFVLILIAFFSTYWYINGPLSKNEVLSYQIELSKKSINKLELLQLKKINSETVLDGFVNSINNILPTTQIKIFKQQNFLKSILLLDDDEITDSDKQLILKYRSYLENKELYSSIDPIYEVEVSLFLTSIVTFILVFLILYIFIPKLYTNKGYKAIFISVLVVLNIMTFAFYHTNNKDEKEIDLIIKSKFDVVDLSKMNGYSQKRITKGI